MNFDLRKNHSQPLFRQFAEALREKVAKGELAPGERLPPLKELADLAGISIFTADRGVNDLIRAGILMRRPKKGTYVCDTASAPDPARTFGKRQVILCVRGRSPGSYTAQTYYGMIFLGMQAAAEEASVDLMLSSMADLEESLQFYRAQPDFLLQGVVLVDEPRTEAYLPIVEKYPQTRFVLANSRIADFDLTPDHLTGVFNDDLGGGYDVAGLALRSGTKEAVIFSRKLADENYAFRVEGMGQAFREGGVAPRAIFNDESRETNERLGRLYMERLLASEKPLPDTILAVNDALIEGAAAALREEVDAPEIRFFGYDALTPPHAAFSFPSVKVDFDKMGQRAVQVLLHSGKRALPKVVNIPARLMARRLMA